jgi:sarcosine oxidase delta subunit
MEDSSNYIIANDLARGAIIVFRYHYMYVHGCERYLYICRQVNTIQAIVVANAIH